MLTANSILAQDSLAAPGKADDGEGQRTGVPIEAHSTQLWTALTLTMRAGCLLARGISSAQPPSASAARFVQSGSLSIAEPTAAKSQ